MRDRFSDKLAGANRRQDYILHKILSEGFNSATEECVEEGDCNVPERNAGETKLEFDWLQLSFTLFSAFRDNLGEPFLDALKGHLRRPEGQFSAP